MAIDTLVLDWFLPLNLSIFYVGRENSNITLCWHVGKGEKEEKRKD